MCGIAGAVGFIDTHVRESLGRIHRAQLHRGPDDEGCWSNLNETDGIGARFLFRRLAIIDLTAAGHQPMIDADTGNVIIFNGEIYNYRELRRELKQHDIHFESNCDTEVLLKAFGLWGIGFLERLRGMFAFAIWDNKAQQVLIARDRLGIKPLYFSIVAQPGERNLIVFASELRSLLAGNLVDRRLNPNAVSSYIWNGFVIGSETIIAGVSQLLPGTVAILNPNGTMQSHRYWTYPRYRPATDGVERLRSELQTSIGQHLVSDVPLGIFLSGGIDSSAVASIAVQQSSAENVCTYNLSFDEADFDESPYAKAVANALGTTHTDIRLTQDQFRAHLNEALSCIDQPTFDALNSYFVSRSVREAGLTVALAGTGGDELFGGYKSFAEIPKAQRTSQALSLLPASLLRHIGNFITRSMVDQFGPVEPQTRWGKAGDVLCTRGSLVNLYQTSYSLFTQSFRDELLETSASHRLSYGLPMEIADFLKRSTNDENTLHAISTLELANFIGERLLRDTDTASMAVSLEVRVPFLDHVVVEACAQVESHRRFKPIGKKQLLRELALSRLDKDLFQRPKAGFGLPIELWSRQSLQSDLESVFADQQLCHLAGLNSAAVARLWSAFKANSPGIYWSRIWSIFVLLWWCRKYEMFR
jgi:asparagine synthase (glutamine-hydrolysing)